MANGRNHKNEMRGEGGGTTAGLLQKLADQVRSFVSPVNQTPPTILPFSSVQLDEIDEQLRKKLGDPNAQKP